IMVKLADRTHNMRTLGSMSAPKRRLIARETLDIYAPVAERLGLYKIKLELEDLGFQALYPQRYRVIERALKRARGNQKEFLGKIEVALTAALKKAGIDGKVESREKHLYSVYRKMRRKKSMLAQVVDVYGLRILVDSNDTCYRTLGTVHATYRPMPGRFKDYIAIPRANGYQSLHTTLFGPNGVPIEVQIRTTDMHQVAEAGVAAHWKYKVGGTTESAQQERARAWISHLMEMQASGNAEEFIESVKVDLFPDKVYVFTPKGAILRLPRGATVVDFAYAVHTDVGNRCVAAKVDRRLSPLRTVLRNGQTVQIITAKGASPNPSWVNFVATAKARTAIRQYLKTLQRSEAIELGQQLLNSALEEFQLNVDRVEPAAMTQALLELNIKERDDLLAQIGLGERLAPLVARRLLPGGHDDKGAITPLTIAGTEGLLVTYARCCRPIPDDPIIAFLSAGRGIVIHRDTCGNVEDYHKHPEKWQPVTWQVGLTRYFSAEVRIEAANKIGMLASVSAAIAGTDTNIGHATVEQRDGEVSLIKLEVEVKDRKHLSRVVRTIRQMPEVLRVSRYLASKRNQQE
ncbi:MAG: bifunctional (p)ppGpp synthetase/guanosine-3',5'-bis(diphosphate) 3'-pyrophosphohydrolase, partial [Steroidobacteraceae bacterium]